MNAALVIVALLALAWIEVRRAPWGWQDENGFHYGEPPEDGADTPGER